ncbi:MULTISPECIES: 3,4-dihydroxy-2-butanone-4-phosphate synthase [Rhodococcus]|uniref:3,4-dihydroxy-2-butanone-4-phosphate synthase n=1 Tax=Rhodococcus TaxID=1827 RepID=UPI000EA99A73|nr:MULTISPECIES: 3,4-dihydroxy-2-butanone-4-phosphate synthase [Rhodococcus]NHU48308.1 3,4-dihydroxy-2-butanone-4-phosphate synthase [Rhodococcus sp. A14]MDI9941086.1 3,4-dihydroxy-2-butanone-4-phosphate synthase [Rhodococcus sp. IEGM 1351]MDJ0418509.1 3,4-dihydroxy-2-butanone-4-phosphate synthase [Rhodococcus opacus]RKM76523.1 hypothetical protein COO55_33995 [Rhodococcus opacus]UZG52856.1 3,4-dihydroxy-2-butanone-4-phosphate synthase [Rhodococcus opacus]
MSISNAIDCALEQLHRGRPVLILDEMGPERGSLVVAASTAETPMAAFLVRQTTGLLTVALPETVCDRLWLPPMWGTDPVASSTFAVAVDLAEGVGTGISAADRAATARRLADPSALPSDFTRPGHVLPVRVADSVRRRERGLDMPGAALELADAATARPAALLAAVPSLWHPADLADEEELVLFAGQHDIPVVALGDVDRWHRGSVPSGSLATCTAGNT